jgi:small subunit ribosomal protein S1
MQVFYLTTIMKEETQKNQGESPVKSKMEELLQNFSFKIPTEGDKITGKVIQVDKNGLYVDLGELGTGIVYGREIKDGFGKNKKKLQTGDTLNATILDLENEDGYVELSVKEAIKEEAWRDITQKMQKRESLLLKVIDVNKGGLMMELNGIVGFMPVSQLTPEHYPRVEDGDKNKIFEILKSYLGTEMKVCVIDSVVEEEKLIFSEKEAYKDSEKEAISEFKVGDIIEGEISGVVDFGAFVKFFPPSKKGSKDEKDMLEGLVHISQLDWKLIENPRDIVKVGDKVKVKIIDIDETRISLSMRDLKADPWSEAAKKYKIGDVVKGNVHKINHFGAFVYLDQDIHGLAHISEFISSYPRKNIDEVIKIGEDYTWEIMSLDPKEHRMGLKLITDKARSTKKKTLEEKPAKEVQTKKEKLLNEEEK